MPTFNRFSVCCYIAYIISCLRLICSYLIFNRIALLALGYVGYLCASNGRKTWVKIALDQTKTKNEVIITDIIYLLFKLHWPYTFVVFDVFRRYWSLSTELLSHDWLSSCIAPFMYLVIGDILCLLFDAWYFFKKPTFINNVVQINHKSVLIQYP